MKNMKQVLVLGGVIVIAAAGLWMTRKGPAHQTSPIGAMVDPLQSSKTNESTDSKKAVSVFDRLKAAFGGGVTTPTGSVTEASKTKPSMSPSLKSEHPFLSDEVTKVMPATLHQFYELDAKTVRSTSENNRYLDLMAANGATVEVERMLLDTSATFSPELVKAHLAATSFYLKALATQRGKADEAALIASAHKIIFADNMKTLEPASPIRQMILEDKTELAHYLHSYYPQQAEVLIEKAAGTDAEKLIKRALAYGKDLEASNRKIAESKQKSKSKSN